MSQPKAFPGNPSGSGLGSFLRLTAGLSGMSVEGIAAACAGEDPLQLFLEQIDGASLSRRPLPIKVRQWACWIAFHSRSRERLLIWLEEQHGIHRETLWLIWALCFERDSLPVQEFLEVLGLAHTLGPCVDLLGGARITGYPGPIDFEMLPVLTRQACLIECNRPTHLDLSFTRVALRQPSLEVVRCPSLRRVDLHFHGIFFGGITLESCPSLEAFTVDTIAAWIPDHLLIQGCPALVEMPKWIRAKRLTILDAGLEAIPTQLIGEESVRLGGLRLADQIHTHTIHSQGSVVVSRIAGVAHWRIDTLNAGQGVVLKDLPDLQTLSIGMGQVEGDLQITGCPSLRRVEHGLHLEGDLRVDGGGQVEIHSSGPCS